MLYFHSVNHEIEMKIFTDGVLKKYALEQKCTENSSHYPWKILVRKVTARVRRDATFNSFANIFEDV